MKMSNEHNIYPEGIDPKKFKNLNAKLNVTAETIFNQLSDTGSLFSFLQGIQKTGVQQKTSIQNEKE